MKKTPSPAHARDRGALTACSHAMMIHGTGARRPAPSEFGLGPRTSASGRYLATLEPAKPLRTRQMQTIRVIVRDVEGHAIEDEFNCRSLWSDASQKCAELEFLVTGDHTLARAYKVPSLRNIARRAPYRDAGQFATLAEVLDHYSRAPEAPAGHTELKPLRLKAVESRQLEAFLNALNGPIVGHGLPRSVSTR